MDEAGKRLLVARIEVEREAGKSMNSAAVELRIGPSYEETTISSVLSKGGGGIGN